MAGVDVVALLMPLLPLQHFVDGGCQKQGDVVVLRIRIDSVIRP